MRRKSNILTSRYKAKSIRDLNANRISEVRAIWLALVCVFLCYSNATAQFSSGSVLANESEVVFSNRRSKIILSGTLTVPAGSGPCDCVVLLSGGGPADRNNSSGGTGKGIFVSLTDSLNQRGIAVLRFDKRGVGQSTGVLIDTTLLGFAEDAEYAVEFVKDKLQGRVKRIGLIGHSEGGLVASLVASNSREIQFVVLMATPGLTYETINYNFFVSFAKLEGVPEEELRRSLKIMRTINELIKSGRSDDRTVDTISQLWREYGVADVDRETTECLSKGAKFLLTYDPAVAYRRLKCPVLAINGDKDILVSSRDNLEAIKRAIESGGNSKVSTCELPNINHLMCDCKSGTLSEMSRCGTVVSSTVIERLHHWILQSRSKP